MEERTIPKEIYLDKTELIENGILSVPPEWATVATKYVSVKRLWHTWEEAPADGEEVVVEFEDDMADYEKHAVCRYDANAEMYVNEHSCYKSKHVKRWFYFKEIVE